MKSQWKLTLVERSAELFRKGKKMLLSSNLNKKTITFLLINILLLVFIISAISARAESTGYQPYSLEADKIDFDYQHGKVFASEQVIFETDDLIIKSDEIVIDLEKELVEARGEAVLLKTSEREVSGTYLEYNYEKGAGQITGAETRIDELNFTGGKIKILQESEHDIEIEKASFTPCILSHPHYQVKASRVEVYRNKKVVAREVGFWFGDHRIFTLPNYVVEYRDGKLYNFTPLPKLSYNSRDGITLEYYYPYQLGDKGEGKMNLHYSQSGERELSVDNSYQLTPELSLTNDISYTKEIEEKENSSNEKEEITGGIGASYQITPALFWINRVDYRKEIENDEKVSEENIVSTGLNYKRSNLDIITTFGYDFINNNRREKIRLGYSPYTDYRVDLYQDYTDEELLKYSYSVGYQGRPVRWKLTRREGYEVDYLPYLSLSFPSYQVMGFNLNSAAGLGRVASEGVVVDKAMASISLKRSLQLTPSFDLSLTGGVEDNIYFDPVPGSYQVYQAGIRGSYRQEVSPLLTITPSLGYEIKKDGGDPVLPADEVDSEQILNPGVELTYLTEEPGSAWVFGVDGSYQLDQQDWESIKLELTRRLDCYSFSIDYNLIDESFGFSFGI